MGRDITVHHIEELCDRRLRIYHKTHGGSGGGGDTPETDSKSYCVLQDAVRINGNYMYPLVYVTNDPYNEDDYEQDEQSRFANLFDIQSQTPDNYRVNTGIQKLITTPTTNSFGVITPIIFRPYLTGEGVWTFSRGTANACLAELVNDDVVQFIHSDDIRYDISDVILISRNKDIIFIRDVNVAGFMTSNVTVDGIDVVKYTNFPLSGTDYQHILAKFNFFKNANPDLQYDNGGWQLLCSTVQFDINSMKEATKRDNVYEVI